MKFLLLSFCLALSSLTACTAQNEGGSNAIQDNPMNQQPGAIASPNVSGDPTGNQNPNLDQSSKKP